MKLLVITLLLVALIFLILFIIISNIIRNILFRKLFDDFKNSTKTEFIGDFKCNTSRNFLSFASSNYSFSNVSLYEFESGILLFPSYSFLGLKSCCKPFVISNKSINSLNLEVCKAEVKSTNDPNTLILIQAKFNTKLELTLFDYDVPITKKIE